LSVVDGVDDLSGVDPVEVDGGDAEVDVAEVAAKDELDALAFMGSSTARRSSRSSIRLSTLS
jgi:hypothetical protein